jgi:LuxR family maltose regulon positive regulatory protein
LCGPLCDAILDSDETLRRLEQVNLFVLALDEHGMWYRYQYLFREFLHTHLIRAQPVRIPTLHRAASEWLAGHGALRMAEQSVPACGFE